MITIEVEVAVVGLIDDSLLVCSSCPYDVDGIVIGDSIDGLGYNVAGEVCIAVG